MSGLFRKNELARHLKRLSTDELVDFIESVCVGSKEVKDLMQENLKQHERYA
jgi:hypothetical protein